MKTKKIISILMAGVITVSALVGCTSQSVTSNDEVTATTESEEKINLTFYYPVNVGGSAAQLIEDLCKEFNDLNKGITVEAVYTGNYDDTVTKIQTAVQGGTPPDLFVSLATQRFSMASSGIARPLDEFIAEDGEEGEAYINDFLEGFMEDSYVDGSIYSIPFQRSTMVLYYNKDAFKEVGLDPEAPPTTWDELVEYGTVLTNDNRYGVGLALNSGSAQWGFTGFALQNSVDGSNLMSEDGKSVLFDTQENMEALEFWLSLQNEHKIMAEGIVQWTELPTQFLSGEVAMIYHTTGNMANISENAEFEFGAAFLPGNKRIAAPTGGGNFYISSAISDERAKAAWEFIKFATSTDNAAQWSLDTGYVATRESSFETDIIKNYYEEVPQAKVAYLQLPYAKPELTTYNASEIWRILNDNIQAAVVGDATVKEALENAQQQADEVLAEYK